MFKKIKQKTLPVRSKFSLLLRTTFVALLAAVMVVPITAEAASQHYDVNGQSIDVPVWPNTNSQGTWSLPVTNTVGTRGEVITVSGVVDNRNASASAGHHYYYYALENGTKVNIIQWKDDYTNHKCIHDGVNYDDWFGFPTFNKKCGYGPMSDGWLGICADCGEYATPLIYTDAAYIKNVSYITVGSNYYSACINCGGLEQGVTLSHNCRRESINKYYVEYNSNGGVGIMGNSTHYVSNSANVTYNGKPATQSTTLSKCTFSKSGYIFQGWSTTPGASTPIYVDQASISSINNSNPGDGSVIKLYAVWAPKDHKLGINPNGGKYNGSGSTTTLTGAMGNTVTLNQSSLTAPSSGTVTFNGNGGTSSSSSLSAAKVFTGWSQSGSFKGSFNGTIYTYPNDSSNDTVTANWSPGTVTLPNASRSGYLFTGWFYDSGCTKPAGSAGNKFLVTENKTLYAGWAGLSLKSVDNYSANSGKGAVNLSWLQNDSGAKAYEIYQSTDNSTWKQVDSASGAATTPTAVNESVTGSSKTFTVPSSGMYTFEIYGAQGQNYGSYQGGKGGKVTGTIFLNKGDSVKLYAGTQGGANNNTGFASGGDMSRIEVNGTSIAMAGGGGGASPTTNGGNGGDTNTANQLTNAQVGQAGKSGGGNGFYAGKSGTVIYHNHVASGCPSHTHTGSPGTEPNGCYTVSNICGSTSFSSRQTGSTFYYGNRDYDGSHIYCVRCGSDDCPGHRDYYYTFTCNVCGAQYPGRTEVGCPASCTSGSYSLGCGFEEGVSGWLCGKTTSTVESSTMAYGGANWVNTNVVSGSSSSAGARSGHGYVSIKSQFIGMSTAMKLDGVPATDMAAPDPVAVINMSIAGNNYSFSWYNPIDNGTKYYHKINSVVISGANVGQKLESNHTENTLTTGVVKYYYAITQNGSYNPTASDSVLNAATGTNTNLITKEVKTAGTWYFCVRAVDKAGNMSGTKRVSFIINAADIQPATTQVTWDGNGELVRGQATETHTLEAQKGLYNDVSWLFTANSVSGKTFLGWNTSRDGSGDWVWDATGHAINDGKYWTNNLWQWKSNLTVYAQWQYNSYSLVYTKRSGICPDNGSTRESGNDAAYTLTFTDVHSILDRSTSPISRRGYLLTGWTTNNTSNTPIYSMGQSVSKLAGTSGAKINIYATWTPITYKVTYRSCGYGDERFNRSITSTTLTCKYDQTFNLWNKSAMTRDGYTLIGWDPTCYKTSNPTYALGQSVGNLTDTDGTEFQLFPVWQENKYTVRYHNDQDNSYVDQKNCLYTSVYNSYINGKDMHFEKKGYYIAYWTSKDGRIVLASDALHESETSNTESTFSKLSAVNGSVVDLYPIWMPNNFYIQYLPYDTKACGGTAPAGATSYTIKVPAFDKSGTENISISGVTIAANPHIAVSGTDKAISNAIKYSYGDTVTIGKNLYTNSNSNKVASTFRGWAFDANAASGPVAEGNTYTNLTPERNQVITLYAVFDQYPTIGVVAPKGIPYNSNDDSIMTLSKLAAIKDLESLSGSYAESWLLDNCVSFAKDREDGNLKGTTKTYISYFSAEELSGIDRPTLLTIVFTTEDSLGQKASATTYWEIYSSGVSNILVD